MFFQLEINRDIKDKLLALATSDGISSSGEIRLLINREYASRFKNCEPNPDDENAVPADEAAADSA